MRSCNDFKSSEHLGVFCLKPLYAWRHPLLVFRHLKPPSKNGFSGPHQREVWMRSRDLTKPVNTRKNTKFKFLLLGNIDWISSCIVFKKPFSKYVYRSFLRFRKQCSIKRYIFNIIRLYEIKSTGFFNPQSRKISRKTNRLIWFTYCTVLISYFI